MKRRILPILLAAIMVLCQTPCIAIAAAADAEDPSVTETEQSVKQETADATVDAGAEKEEAAPAAVSENAEAAPLEASEKTETAVTEEEPAQPEKEVAAEAAKLKEVKGKSEVPAEAPHAKDVYIDNTVDNSKSYVTGVIHLSGSGGTQAGFDPEVTVYENSASVTYSNPGNSQVQGMIDAAYTSVYTKAENVRKRGKSGEFHMSTTESTGKVWDNRKYTTVEDGDAVLIGDSDYLQGAYGVDTSYTRTHIASGDYGKYTYYRVEATGYVNGWDIKVTDDGNGTGSADREASLAEETVTLTAAAADGYAFKEWQVVSGGAVIDNAESESATFSMPYADVEIKAVFEPLHKHTLVKTDKVDASCTEDGTEAYWTCSECGKLFSDEAGTKEISKPVVISAAGHKASAAVRENEVAPTFTTEGSYEEVRYCSVCGAEISRVKKTIPVISYVLTAGDNGTYVVGSGDSLSFTFKRTYNDEETFGHFSGIQVDGADVDSSAYSAVSGSVIVTLGADYLESLDIGDHIITAVFEDGNNVDADFTVSEAAADADDDDSDSSSASSGTSSGGSSKGSSASSSAGVKTGDESKITLWSMSLIAALAGIWLITYRRRRTDR